jgi:hypothetical protein
VPGFDQVPKPRRRIVVDLVVDCAHGVSLTGDGRAAAVSTMLAGHESPP